MNSQLSLVLLLVRPTSLVLLSDRDRHSVIIDLAVIAAAMTTVTMNWARCVSRLIDHIWGERFDFVAYFVEICLKIVHLSVCLFACFTPLRCLLSMNCITFSSKQSRQFNSANG